MPEKAKTLLKKRLIQSFPKEKTDTAWQLIKKAYIKAGDGEAIKLINRITPRKEKQATLMNKAAELGD